jgi:hypothetical protein
MGRVLLDARDPGREWCDIVQQVSQACKRKTPDRASAGQSSGAASRRIRAGQFSNIQARRLQGRRIPETAMRPFENRRGCAKSRDVQPVDGFLMGCGHLLAP